MRKQTKFIAYITKYALTEGILKMEVNDCFDISPKMVSKADVHYSETYHNPDWHRTEDEAFARAEEMRKSKLKSLDKQRARIEALTFKIKELAQ
jgi:hypothetical protein